MSTVIESGTREGRIGDTGMPLGIDTRTSPSPAVRGATPGAPGWRGSSDGEGLATALGWFSVGLGLAQLVAPQNMSRLVGLSPGKRSTAVMRLAGLRELGHGVGILANPRPKEWVGTRVAGDAFDLALLGGTLAVAERKDRTLLATLAVLGVTVLDVLAFEGLSEARKVPGGDTGGVLGGRVIRSITIGLPVEEVYGFWRDFQNLPRFMRYLQSVEDLGGGRSHWTTKGPAGTRVEWDAEIVEDRPNELISWRSVGTSELYNAGTVRFRKAPGDRGTEVQVEMEYAPPGGKVAAAFLKLLRREPGQQVAEDLRAFKQVLETGEIVVSDASIVGEPHAARPPSGEDERRW